MVLSITTSAPDLKKYSKLNKLEFPVHDEPGVYQKLVGPDMVVFCNFSESDPWLGVGPLIPFQYPELYVHDVDGLTPMNTGLVEVPSECISP